MGNLSGNLIELLSGLILLPVDLVSLTGCQTRPDLRRDVRSELLGGGTANILSIIILYARIMRSWGSVKLRHGKGVK